MSYNTDIHAHTNTHTHIKKTHTLKHIHAQKHIQTHRFGPSDYTQGFHGLKGPILTFHIIISIVKSTLICTAHRKVSFLELTIWKSICSNSTILMFAQLYWGIETLTLGYNCKKFLPGDEWSGLPFPSFESRIAYYLYTFIRVTATVNLYYLYCATKMADLIITTIRIWARIRAQRLQRMWNRQRRFF